MYALFRLGRYRIVIGVDAMAGLILPMICHDGGRMILSITQLTKQWRVWNMSNLNLMLCLRTQKVITQIKGNTNPAT